VVFVFAVWKKIATSTRIIILWKEITVLMMMMMMMIVVMVVKVSQVLVCFTLSSPTLHCSFYTT